MLHNPFSTPVPLSSGRPSLQLTGLQSLHRPSPSGETFSDSRTHGYQGPSRSVTFNNASSAGGSAISKSPSGERCVVVGKDSLRVLRVSDGSEAPASEHKYVIGRGGSRIDASKNFWQGSGLKVDSAMTDVVWCHKSFDTKILTSARNGEILLWDLHKSGSLKYESRKKAHARSINKLSYSNVMPHYCSTGSSDGNLRVWDLRNLSKEFLHVHHSFAIRTVMFSPSILEPFHAITGLDNGSMCRWDLRMGQKGLVERVPLAHTGAILSFDWCESGINGGWLASAGLDRTVKVWDFSDGQVHLSRKPAYVLHASYPVRRLMWRPGYETELAIASYNESAYNPTSKSPSSSSVNTTSILSTFNADAVSGQVSGQNSPPSGRADVDQFGVEGSEIKRSATEHAMERYGDMIEIWDVRRPWIAKWSVQGSSCEGGVSDMTFADSHALWVQHPSGAFSQMDLRFCDKPIDSVPRSALTWAPMGSLTFISDSINRWEVPYDDVVHKSKAELEEKVKPQKRLGDNTYTPKSQTLGTLFDVSDPEDWETFSFLARGYRIEGADQPGLCELNAEIAFEAGNFEAGRIWLLLRSLLADVVTSRSASPPLAGKDSPRPLPLSIFTPATVSVMKKSPGKGRETRSSSSDPPNLPRKVTHKQSGRLTPVSMVLSPSVRSPASPVLTQSVASREKSQVSDESDSQKRKSVTVDMLDRPQRSSIRPNTSSLTVHSDARQSVSRTRVGRQFGARALDESDPSEGEGSLPSPEGHFGLLKGKISAENVGSPTSVSMRASQSRALPSPGVLEDNEWSEDEPVSPASSESESDNSVASTTAARSSSLQRPSRTSRPAATSIAIDSTPTMSDHRELPRTDSHSSVLTVIAGGDKSVAQEQPMQSEAVADTDSSTQSLKSRKRHSEILSGTNIPAPHLLENHSLVDENEIRFLEWNHLAIKEAEERYRLTAWSALREILEQLATNGDVQMCAMLACVAPTELGISAPRSLQFIESYIDVLSRFRMHEVLAYVRKFAPSAEVRQTTQIQTTIYSVCQTCRKTIVQAALSWKEGVQRSWSGFSQCFECKRAAIMCTICRLPVRSSLVLCGVCSHGGHRDCYHQFYSSRRMVEVPMAARLSHKPRLRPATASEGSNPNSPSTVADGSVPDQLAIAVFGHPCAAGCGHYCWTANEKKPSA